jgi:hypothetical protein
VSRTDDVIEALHVHIDKLEAELTEIKKVTNEAITRVESVTDEKHNLMQENVKLKEAPSIAVVREALNLYGFISAAKMLEQYTTSPYWIDCWQQAKAREGLEDEN